MPSRKTAGTRKGAQDVDGAGIRDDPLLYFLFENSSCFAGPPEEFANWLKETVGISSLLDLAAAVENEDSTACQELVYTSSTDGAGDDNACGIYPLKLREFCDRLKEAADHVTPSSRTIISDIHRLLADGASLTAEQMLEAYMHDHEHELSDATIVDGDALSTALSWAAVLISYYKHQVISKEYATDQWHVELELKLREAMEVNPVVPRLLLHAGGVGADENAASNSDAQSGGVLRDAAERYVELAGESWTKAPDAHQFLLERALAENDGIANIQNPPNSEGSISTADNDDIGSAKQTSSGAATLMETTETNSSMVDRKSDDAIDVRADGDATCVQQAPQPSRSRKEMMVWFLAVRDDPIFAELLGRWDDALLSQKISIPASKRTAVCVPTASNLDGFVVIERSLRSIASALPFALRFQLERSLLNSSVIPVQIVEMPGGGGSDIEAKRDEAIGLAREMASIFILAVLPSLVMVDWNASGRGKTWTELFALNLFGELDRIIRDIKNVAKINFDMATVEAIEKETDDMLRRAEMLCGFTEEELTDGAEDFIQTIQSRAMWPMAEYRCRFDLCGHLVPTDFEVVNLDVITSGRRKMLPNTRRAMRQEGWSVRDRFVRVTLELCEPFLSNVAGWISSEPQLCGRRYQLLFDKGVSRNVKCFLYSPTPNVSRDEFLTRLGCFGCVNLSKAGDRIGLAFSLTAPICQLGLNQIIAIPEVARNGYSFSDGVGVMGLGVALQCKKLLGLSQIPGAIQVRLGGVKGMLSLKPDFEHNAVGLRPTQLKFPSTNRILEVKKAARPVKEEAKIFRDLLYILHALGVPLETFRELQMKAAAEMVLEQDSGADLSTLVRRMHCSVEEEYFTRVLQNGKKLDGRPFSVEELDNIVAAMSSAREKIHLRCPNVQLYQGVLDEHGILEEGQILVGNGAVTGEVLISRSPALFPGDIQKACAVKGSPHDHRLQHLGCCIVFSALGARPLADKLGGGDLDGDEFIVIGEEEILRRVTIEAPHDYGSQESFASGKLDVEKCFPSSLPEAKAPSLEGQADTLRKFMVHGNLVSDSKDAFDRVCDKIGLMTYPAKQMAELHQIALDARKRNFHVGEDLLFRMDTLQTWPAPVWKRNRRGGRAPNSGDSLSVPGILSVFWGNWIGKLGTFRRRRGISATCSAEEERNEISGEVLMQMHRESRRRNQHSFSLAPSKEQCSVCRIFVSLRQGQESDQCEKCGSVLCKRSACERKHWEACFRSAWISGDRGESFVARQSAVRSSQDPKSMLSASSAAAASAVADSDVSRRSGEGGKDVIVGEITFNDDVDDSMSSDIVDSLIDIVFGRSKPSCNGLDDINWDCLSNSDLQTMVELAKVEFFQSFRADLQKSLSRRDAIDAPHIYDVFTMRRELRRGNIDLAICLPSESYGNLLVWRDHSDLVHALRPEFHRYRVASLSGTARIIEGLKSQPQPQGLMHQAMNRNRGSLQVALSKNDEALQYLNPAASGSLNLAQRRAVATVVVPGVFTFGFFVVQGPPGTGKTLTLCHILDGLGGGLVLAPSNAAIANVALKLEKLSSFSNHKTLEVVVFGEGCDESVHRFSPTHRHRRYRQFLQEKKNCSSSSECNELRRKFAAWLGLHSSTDYDTLDKVFEDMCPKVDDQAGQKKMARILSSAKVVLCTLNSAGSKSLRRIVPGKFDTVIIDEAGQCTEAETYIAFSMPGIKRVVLIGDPKQLPATVVDVDVQEMGFKMSWMGRMLDLHSDRVHLLNVQYRCDQQILQFSNDQYYSGRILSASRLSSRLPKVDRPISFVDTSPLGEEMQESTSYINIFEASLIRRLVCSDDDIQKIIGAYPQASCIIITPYAAQRKLLEKEMAKVRHLKKMSLAIATVDSFQGQEADIVILSTVRTKRVGFTDDPQRINVALTRARRVLRVVGDLKFFQGLPSSSHLYRLSTFILKKGFVDDKFSPQGTNKELAWKPPDWTQKRVWEVRLNPRFHMCLREMSLIDKNVALNTLLKISIPDTGAMHARPKDKPEGRPGWMMSALKGYEEKVWVMWIAKEGSFDANGKRSGPILDAHFAGSYRKCLQFRQKHPMVPANACHVKPDLSGVVANERGEDNDDGLEIGASTIDLSWTLTNDLRDGILSGDMVSLPEGCFELDEFQVQILGEKPPLMLESRSGTGKTNVLFQHCIAYAREVGSSAGRPIAFITVSPRLRKELRKRYEEVENIETSRLPSIEFFSLAELLDALEGMTKSSLQMKDASRYLEYYYQRTDYSGIPVEPAEVENEIGGVICGSLEAAVQKQPLDRDSYLRAIRSNVSTDTKEGVAKRHNIYDEYEKYRKWKKAGDRFDINDVILKLIAKDLPQLFDACYLDEVQDFSYAAIYFISSIAGKDTLNWVCAGDTAQMISPGCSFKFDGLKQVMRTVRNDETIDHRLKKVVNLKVNYRTTKSILKVANNIIDVAKKAFPDAIQHVAPEQAIKDLGFKVTLVYWDSAIQTEASFGANQALIFSSEEAQEEELFGTMQKWLKEHPFVLSSLESKGLEFDDVVVAFDFERKSWDVNSDRASSLRMLLELYVAVTRAKERVVILLKKDVEAQRRFFESTLENCDLQIEEAITVFAEFDRGSTTTPEQWFAKGQELFEEENYRLAASCFKSASTYSYANWATGLHEKSLGRKNDAKESFRKSAHQFFALADYRHALDLLVEVMNVPPWDNQDDKVYNESRAALPSYFTPEKTVTFALSRSRYDEISLEDLRSPVCLDLVARKRGEPLLLEAIRNFDSDDQRELAVLVPLLLGDARLSEGKYQSAVGLFIRGKDFKAAQDATDQAIGDKFNAGRANMLAEISKLWLAEKSPHRLTNPTKLLVRLFSKPKEVTSASLEDCLNSLGRDVILRAFEDHESISYLDLYDVDPNQFRTEISATLVKKYDGKPMEVVQWYHGRNDSQQAEKFVSSRLLSWSNDELLSFLSLGLRPKGLLQVCDTNQSLLIPLIEQCLKAGDSWDLALAMDATERALASRDDTKRNANDLIQIWFSRRNNEQVVVKMSSLPFPAPEDDLPTNTALFINLISRPREIGRSEKYRSLVMHRFGPDVIEAIVAFNLNSRSPEDIYSILKLFSPFAFAHRKPEKKEEEKKKDDDSSVSLASDSSLSGMPSLLGHRNSSSSSSASSSSSDNGDYSDSDDSEPPPLIPRAGQSDSSSSSSSEDEAPPRGGRSAATRRQQQRRGVASGQGGRGGIGRRRY